MTTRIRSLCLVGALLGVASLVSSVPARPTDAAAQTRPNVLIILTDDQRAGTLSFMPQTRRWFARGGTRYPRGVTAIPRCCPSRATIFTGRYAHNHGVKTNDDSDQLDQDWTLQRILQDAGYNTGIAGKLFNDWPTETDPRYWDRWAIFQGSYSGERFNVNGRVTRPIERYSTDYISGKARRFLEDFEQSDDDPWYLYVAPYAPHHPNFPAERHKDARTPRWRGNPAVFEEDLSDKPPFARKREIGFRRANATRRQQLKTLLSVDDLVDSLMRKIRELGEGDDTLAFFLSDNGRLWGEHGITGKGLPYTQSVEVPFLVRWPNRINAGARDDSLVSTVDVAPTVVDVTGAPLPEGAPEMDGYSLLSDHEREHQFIEHWHRRDGEPTLSWSALRSPAGTYTEYYLNHETSNDQVLWFREYYDYRDDRWELDNVLASSPGTVDTTQMAAQLSLYRRCAGASCP